MEQDLGVVNRQGALPQKDALFQLCNGIAARRKASEFGGGQPSTDRGHGKGGAGGHETSQKGCIGIGSRVGRHGSVERARCRQPVQGVEKHCANVKELRVLDKDRAQQGHADSDRLELLEDGAHLGH